MKHISTKGWLLPYKVTTFVRIYWMGKFASKIYVKPEGETAGDNKFCVPAGCTLVETLSDEATNWMREKFPEGKEVPIEWEEN